jgi:peptide/nickel transport system permease protein
MGVTVDQLTAKRRKGGPWARMRSIPILIALCALVIAVFLLTALLANHLAPADPLKQHLDSRLSPPYWLADGINVDQPRYVLGSDQLGRDVLSRIIHGSRVSLVVGFAAVCIGGLFGSSMGMLAGYFGKNVDEVIMMVADIQLAFPFILLAIAVIAVLGPSFTNLVVLIGISGWVTYARIARAEVLSIKEKEYVEAIRCLGGDPIRIILRHLLPNALSPLIVVGTLDLARTIILESTLSFLGLGIQPPTPSWGGMLGEGRQYLGNAWWISIFPGLFLMAVALSVSRIGDWLRDVLDPTLRTG